MKMKAIHRDLQRYTSYGKKKYSKLFEESLIKTIKYYSNYSPMLNWQTIGGTIEKNGHKLLKCSDYSPMLYVP